LARSAESRSGLEFIDLLHHRFITFAYDIGTRFDLARCARTRGTRYWGDRLLSLAGIDVSSANHTLANEYLFEILPLLMCSVRNSEAVEKSLERLLSPRHGSVRIHVLGLLTSWTPSHPEQRLRLGRSTLGDGVSLLGRHVCLAMRRGVIRISGVHRDVESLLPSGKSQSLIVAVLELFAVASTEFQLEINCREDVRPVCRLGCSSAALGRRSWLKVDPSSESEPPLRVPLGAH
jgi:predicted component of type VI protein secretion system